MEPDLNRFLVAPFHQKSSIISMLEPSQGKLILIATQTADSVYCENTPKALRLFSQFGIAGKGLRVVHEGNETKAAQGLAGEVKDGLTVVYLSEAGVPGICDPGFRLVRAARKAGLTVEAVGVPSAFLNALVISGLPTDSFFFGGFPPPKSVARQKFFKESCFNGSTTVFYESCHRLLASMEDLKVAIGPERWVCLAGELTKMHESVQTAPLPEIKLPSNPKGEWVVCVAKEGYAL
jgi:16S rRNA (cytidine1402-2'-O)-methyltransferase